MKGHRKFVFAIIAMILPSVLLGWNKLESGSYTAIMIAVISGFLTTNVIQAIGVKMAEKTNVEVQVREQNGPNPTS